MSGGFLALQAKKSKEKKQTIDLEDAFKNADTDKDGKLTLEEWVDVLQRTGHNISRSEVVEMFREKDLNMDGVMSYDEFLGHDTRMALAFKAIDKNGDGYLSKTEFRRICPNMSEEQVEAAFSKFDKDKTGRVNYKEFCSMMKRKKWRIIFFRKGCIFISFAKYERSMWRELIYFWCIDLNY